MNALTYLLASAAIGIAQIADAVALFRSDGRGGRFAFAFALMEYVWGAMSYLAWRDGTPSVPRWLPASFVVYVLAFTAASLLLAIQTPRESELTIPRSLVVAGGVFGAYFALASALAATRA